MDEQELFIKSKSKSLTGLLLVLDLVLVISLALGLGPSKTANLQYSYKNHTSQIPPIIKPRTPDQCMTHVIQFPASSKIKTSTKAYIKIQLIN